MSSRFKGRTHSEESIQKMRLSHRKSSVGIHQIHCRLRKLKPKPKFCELCHIKFSKELANLKNHNYTENPDDYAWLCCSCHSILDKKGYKNVGQDFRISNKVNGIIRGMAETCQGEEKVPISE